jgi:hypothetical protein
MLGASFDAFKYSRQFHGESSPARTALGIIRSKRAYAGRHHFEVEVALLCERHLGMRLSRYPSKYKERLAPAHKELAERGFLHSVHYELMSTKKAEKVCYIFTSRRTMTQSRPAVEAASPIEPTTPQPAPSKSFTTQPQLGQAQTQLAKTHLMARPSKDGQRWLDRTLTVKGHAVLLISQIVVRGPIQRSRSGAIINLSRTYRVKLLSLGWLITRRVALPLCFQKRFGSTDARHGVEIGDTGDSRQCDHDGALP